MAKITGPLLSETASGSIDKRLTFSQRKTGQQVRFQKAQIDVITPKRIIQRDYFKIVCGWWKILDYDEHEEWEELSN